MRHAIIPFIVYIIIQIIVFFVGYSMVKNDKNQNYSSLMRTYIMGQLLIFAIIEVLAVPMILLRLRFNVLYYTVIIIIAVLFAFGLKRFLFKSKISLPSLKTYIKSMSVTSLIILVLACALIIFQFSMYYIGQHLDEDDARWLAEANDAIEYGDMMTRNISTGEYQGAFVAAKDVTSPWAMAWAILAKTMHVRASTAVHTAYAPFELLVMYMIYYLIARELFKKNDARCTFLLLTVVINMFYAGTIYTQSVFSLVRIWQGKATVAAVIIPMLSYLFICINKRDETNDWLSLPIVSCGACVLSGMGISLSAFLIIIYGVYNIIAYKNWKRIPLLILALVPAVVFSLVYFFFKG